MFPVSRQGHSILKIFLCSFSLLSPSSYFCVMLARTSKMWNTSADLVRFCFTFHDLAPVAPTFNREEWLSKKFTLGLDFPNVSHNTPCLISSSNSSPISSMETSKWPNLRPSLSTSPTSTAWVRFSCLAVKLISFFLSFIGFLPTPSSSQKRQGEGYRAHAPEWDPGHPCRFRHHVLWCQLCEFNPA